MGIHGSTRYNFTRARNELCRISDARDQLSSANSVLSLMPPTVASHPDVQRLTLTLEEKTAVGHWKGEFTDTKNTLVAEIYLLSDEEMKTFMLYYGDEIYQHGIKYEAPSPPSSQGDPLGLDMMI
ncbi:hypothetical protein PENARI_c011G00733 [Penicillium arizonense]|uniref:Uncharacterized protein n=1 Tax=Penicillium arizonense TaxID=1835702 RepID=A0A1F5LFU5_PENAI|nr:hypothetical protein PENARI_c011G00733 [Penicillium arizonense]OGE52078.1 hypothetical protein PENARI_c011G00733 [Penicillium arizonense]